MTTKWIAVMGTWILTDAIFSIHCYLGKEGFKENYIRIIRGIIGATLIIWS